MSHTRTPVRTRILDGIIETYKANLFYGQTTRIYQLTEKDLNRKISLLIFTFDF